MAKTKEQELMDARNERLFSALQGVSDVLSEWPDSEWAQVQPIQAMVNQAQEMVGELESEQSRRFKEK